MSIVMQLNWHTAILMVWLALAGSGFAPAQQVPRWAPDHGLSATFSIIAVDPASGTLGAAVASKYPAVGRVVPYLRAGLGAFCTQHYHNPQFGERALDLLATPMAPQQVLAELLRDDPRHDQRQLALVDIHGNVAQHNPTAAPDSSSYWGSVAGKYFAVQGNTLAGPAVLTGIARAYESTTGSLADRLMAALVAGDRAGGDHRGRLAAGIRVTRTGEPANWFELYVDQSDNAVEELLKRYLEADHPARGNWKGPSSTESP
jgi:uncharacterized Ntn-hydrolase superfamily protein